MICWGNLRLGNPLSGAFGAFRPSRRVRFLRVRFSFGAGLFAVLGPFVSLFWGRVCLFFWGRAFLFSALGRAAQRHPKNGPGVFQAVLRTGLQAPEVHPPTGRALRPTRCQAEATSMFRGGGAGTGTSDLRGQGPPRRLGSSAAHCCITGAHWSCGTGAGRSHSGACNCRFTERFHSAENETSLATPCRALTALRRVLVAPCTPNWFAAN
jgi:hypothetical protein